LLTLQVHESTYVSDVSQLLVVIRIVFNDDSIKEELLKAISLCGGGGTRYENKFYASLLEINVPIHKHVSTTKDDAPGMTMGFAKETNFLELLLTTVSFIGKLYVQK
jgi:hypothetical protein